MHVERLEKHTVLQLVTIIGQQCQFHVLRLMSPAFLQAFKLCAIKVVLQYWFVVGMRALVNDDSCPLSW